MMSRTCAGYAVAVMTFPSAVQSCADIPGAQKLESDRYLLAYQTRPGKIAVGQHFAMELAVCAKGGQPTPETLRVDAHMPEHRHGMNYRATVKPLDGGRYQAEEFMFHMPGRWEFLFEVRSGGKTDRVTRSVTLE
jgi:hypothetical protein